MRTQTQAERFHEKLVEEQAIKIKNAKTSEEKTKVYNEYQKLLTKSSQLLSAQADEIRQYAQKTGQKMFLNGREYGESRQDYSAASAAYTADKKEELKKEMIQKGLLK